MKWFKFRILEVASINIPDYRSMNAVQVHGSNNYKDTSTKCHGRDTKTEDEDISFNIEPTLCILVVHVIVVDEAVDKHEVGQDDLDETKRVVCVVSHLSHLLHLIRFVCKHLRERFEDETHCRSIQTNGQSY